MAITQGEGGSVGGGGVLGGSANLCVISPEDTVGTIGNLITRIEELEKAVSSILGADLFTERLSNLSEQVGWVYGVEYMGVPGWIQTEYGTLIPPPGFTLSGNGFTLPNACTGEDTPYQGVVMDENGVLQFGFTPAGELCGASVETWNEGGNRYVGLYQATAGMPGNPLQIERGVSIYSTSFGATGTTIAFVVENAGLYEVSGSATFDTTITANGAIVLEGGIDTFTAVGSGVSRGSVSNRMVGGFVSGAVDPDEPLTDGFEGDPGLTISGIFNLPANGEAIIAVSVILTGGAAMSGSVHQENFWVKYVGPYEE